MIQILIRNAFNTLISMTKLLNNKIFVILIKLVFDYFNFIVKLKRKQCICIINKPIKIKYCIKLIEIQ